MFAVRAGVALHAVLEIGYAFAQVLRADPVWLMFVASKASVAACIVVNMARCAGHIVIAFQQEKPRVVELGRLP